MLRAKQNRFLWRNAALIALVVTSLVSDGTATAIERSLAGQLLVATAEMKDPRFAESIIYLVKHSDQGAFGLIINKPITKGTFSEVLKGFGIQNQNVIGEIDVHYGGPVSRQQGFLLHSDEITLDSSTKMTDGFAVTADVEIVQMLALGTGPRQALLIMGYSGWGPGQLEMEIKANSWFTISADKSLVFGKDPEKKWRRAMDKRQIPL
ncbi:MAG TPA: YqgE/AlgH family protein [Candidatus Binatia bacterium]|nr:YqgE/AlgH family protein [Candidatus Binatia bacterium]